MRKFLALAATVILGGALLIAGCGNDNKQAASDGKQVLKIGATAVPSKRWYRIKNHRIH